VVKDGPTEEIIQSEALSEIYDMDIPIQEMDNCRICVYFSS
jgi:iron complex transport system ATP-binding protein